MIRLNATYVHFIQCPQTSFNVHHHLLLLHYPPTAHRALPSTVHVLISCAVKTHKSSRKCRVKLRALTAWVHGTDVRPIAHWRRFKVRWQASMPGDSAGRATDTRYQRLYSHTSNTRTQQFSARSSIYLWQSLDTRGQIVKMASSSESSD